MEFLFCESNVHLCRSPLAVFWGGLRHVSNVDPIPAECTESRPGRLLSRWAPPGRSEQRCSREGNHLLPRGGGAARASRSRLPALGRALRARCTCQAGVLEPFPGPHLAQAGQAERRPARQQEGRPEGRGETRGPSCPAQRSGRQERRARDALHCSPRLLRWGGGATRQAPPLWAQEAPGTFQRSCG